MGRGDAASPPAGFTLIEILLATAIFAVLVTALYGAYQGTARTVRNCQRGFAACTDILRLERVLPGLLTGASAQAQPRPEAVFKGEGRSLVFTTLADGRYAAGRSPLAVVRVGIGKDRGLEIETDSLGFLAETPEDSRRRYRFPTVREVTFKYHDENETHDSWNAAEKGRLPRAVSVEATATDETGMELPYRRHIAVPALRDLPITGLR